MITIILHEPLTELTAVVSVDMDFTQTLSVTPGIHRKPCITEGGYSTDIKWHDQIGGTDHDYLTPLSPSIGQVEHEMA